MFGIPNLEFRFRGKSRLLLDIYYCFIEQGSPALHPTQIAKHTGISLLKSLGRLDATPELFVKLPSRAGDVTRYRITSSTSARSHEEGGTGAEKCPARISVVLQRGRPWYFSP